MTPENLVNEDVAVALMHYKFCVLPKPNEIKKLPVSPWSMADPDFHVGIVWRLNTGVAMYGKRMIRFGIPGQPDWLGWLFKTGQMMALEAKSASGTLTPDQRAYAKLAASSGILCGVVRSYAECEVLFQKWGLKRAGDGEGRT